MNKYAILGYPLKHTMSPPIHKRLFELADKKAEYEICEFSEDILPQKAEYLNSLSGYNITIPFKVDIIKYLDELDYSAQKYDSVNCVVNRDGKNIGFNTDCTGFLRAIEAAGMKLDGRVLQYGCGGVGRMIAVEALLHGAELTVSVLRGMENTAEPVSRLAEKLMAGSSKRLRVVHADEIDGDYDLLINATPVGMFPKTEACPAEDEIISRCKGVFDVIYNPDITLLMKRAETLGKKSAGGMSMLVWQAVVAHEIWDGAEYETADIEALVSEMTALMNSKFA